MIRTITLLLINLFALQTFAAVVPSPTVTPPSLDFTKMKAKEIEKLTGKKLNLLQKIELKLLQKKMGKKTGDDEMTEKQKKKASLSMILGITSIVFLFIPVIGILAIPMAILAIIFGASSMKGNSNTKSIVGVVTGGVTLLLFVIALAVAIAYLGAL
jgi:hypothetical protein